MTEIDATVFDLTGRFVLINVVPFFLVFHLVMRRRKQAQGKKFSELGLIGGEIQIVGLLGYYVILSIYFFSIPVLQYFNTKPGYNILLVEPDGFTVYCIGLISFTLVVCGIYLKARRRWAYRLAMFLLTALLVYAFFSVLEFGLISLVPVVLFSYLVFRLRRKSLVEELPLGKNNDRVR